MKNCKSPASALKQKGFSLLTGFILVIIMFGALAFFLAGSGISTSVGAGYANNSKVSSLLGSGSYLSTGFDAVVLGGTSPTAVTFDSAVNTGMLNPVTGGSVAQAVDPSILARNSAIDGYWIYRSNDISMDKVGDPGAVLTPDYTMMVSGIKKGICQQINNTLHGLALNATIPDLADTDANIIGTPTAAVPTNAAPLVFPLPVNVVTAGWASGCFATTTVVGADVNYVFIHTVLAQ